MKKPRNANITKIVRTRVTGSQLTTKSGSATKLFFRVPLTVFIVLASSEIREVYIHTEGKCAEPGQRARLFS
jgi:hypothetical protein